MDEGRPGWRSIFVAGIEQKPVCVSSPTAMQTPRREMYATFSHRMHRRSDAWSVIRRGRDRSVEENAVRHARQRS